MAPSSLINKKAPEFELPDHTGATFKFTPGESGRPTALFFYPKSGTYGCTREVCQFRDALAEKEVFKSTQVEVIGISPDPVQKQKEFVEKQKVTYPILSDEKGTARKAYGVPRGFGGLTSSSRVTFAIDAEGIIRDVLDATINFAAHEKFVTKWLDKQVKPKTPTKDVKPENGKAEASAPAAATSTAPATTAAATSTATAAAPAPAEAPQAAGEADKNKDLPEVKEPAAPEPAAAPISDATPVPAVPEKQTVIVPAVTVTAEDEVKVSPPAAEPAAAPTVTEPIPSASPTPEPAPVDAAPEEKARDVAPEPSTTVAPTAAAEAVAAEPPEVKGTAMPEPTAAPTTTAEAALEAAPETVTKAPEPTPVAEGAKENGTTEEPKENKDEAAKLEPGATPVPPPAPTATA